MQAAATMGRGIAPTLPHNQLYNMMILPYVAALTAAGRRSFHPKNYAGHAIIC
jgi:hypothetical protein